MVRKIGALAALFAALALVHANAGSVEVQEVEVVNYGLYSATPIQTRKDPQGISGSFVSDVHHVRTTRDVPAQIGVRFGFGYRVIGQPAGAKVVLRKVVIFPDGGLQPPGSHEHVDRQQYAVAVPVGHEGHTGYQFDEPWELKPGRWTIELWYEDRKLASQGFEVFKP